MRVEVPHRHQGLRAWRSLSRIHTSLLDSDDALRSAFGIAGAREFYVLTIFRNHDLYQQWDRSETLTGLRKEWPGGVWTMRWNGDNEFGHWDGLRLRRTKLGTAVEVPDAAKAAASTGSADEPADRDHDG